MRVTIRAFNAEGYHRDIMVANDQQVLRTWGDVHEPTSSMLTGLIGHGIAICPQEFPEMVRFEVVIERHR